MIAIVIRCGIALGDKATGGLYVVDIALVVLVGFSDIISGWTENDRGGVGYVERPDNLMAKGLHCGVQLVRWTIETCALGNCQLSTCSARFFYPLNTFQIPFNH